MTEVLSMIGHIRDIPRTSAVSICTAFVYALVLLLFIVVILRFFLVFL